MVGNITFVRKHSLAEAAGILAGEKLLTVNGEKVADIIELSYHTADSHVELEIESVEGEVRRLVIEKHPDEELGLEYSAAVFDKVNTCRNKCVFCFVDQMIPGMRPGLYVRDDDFRLSFLYGNFITLTNLSEEDYSRIISNHLSPLYVSVHATDPDVRCLMMHNRFAGQLLEKMERLLQAGIEIHTQVVCCPGYNDGAVLEKTFTDLYERHPGVLSMAVVPVGITKNREHLPLLRTFSREEAQNVVDSVTAWQSQCRAQTGKSFIYLGDEFYLLAEKDVPPAELYDGFPQLENGIGLTRSFLDEWEATVAEMSGAKNSSTAVIPVGTGAYNVLFPLMKALNERFATKHRFVPVDNKFFGGRVNVTGLLTGGDILSEVCSAQRVVLPSVVLNNDNMFLDDMSLDQFRKKFSGKLELAKNARELLHLLLES